ncbi:MAG: iron ABC transporter permease [Candidatus Omnitrophica bacterium]|nr:iron ABC transporter permease [Candidatus Omnitrophota bacterium]MCM8799981.1 iron ABC transporter permease [Candidatus Omnitrophota bacterium]
MIYRFKKRVLFLLIVISILIVILALNYGSSPITLSEIFLKQNRTILYLRIYRIILGAFVGAGLAVCGAVLQAILRNPLAEPYILGTSSGACLFAVLGTFLNVSYLYLPILAFLGAVIVTFLVYCMAKEDGKIPVQSLILSGVIVSVSLSGVIMLLVSLSPDEAIHGIAWWLWGSLEIYDFKALIFVGAVVAFSILIIFIFNRELDAISLGEEEAIHLGIDIERLKKIFFLLVSFVVATIVCICGIIGFVGLIVPHLVRFIFGPLHRRVIFYSIILGSSFLVLSDTVSRKLLAPSQIPIGVITSLVGSIAFIILLKMKQKIKIR